MNTFYIAAQDKTRSHNCATAAIVTQLYSIVDELGREHVKRVSSTFPLSL